MCVCGVWVGGGGGKREEGESKVAGKSRGGPGVGGGGGVRGDGTALPSGADGAATPVPGFMDLDLARRRRTLLGTVASQHRLAAFACGCLPAAAGNETLGRAPPATHGPPAISIPDPFHPPASVFVADLLFTRPIAPCPLPSHRPRGGRRRPPRPPRLPSGGARAGAHGAAGHGDRGRGAAGPRRGDSGQPPEARALPAGAAAAARAAGAGAAGARAAVAACLGAMLRALGCGVVEWR